MIPQSAVECLLILAVTKQADVCLFAPDTKSNVTPPQNDKKRTILAPEMHYLAVLRWLRHYVHVVVIIHNFALANVSFGCYELRFLEG